jgi:hypothetical protein
MNCAFEILDFENCTSDKLSYDISCLSFYASRSVSAQTTVLYSRGPRPLSYHIDKQYDIHQPSSPPPDSILHISRCQSHFLSSSEEICPRCLHGRHEKLNQQIHCCRSPTNSVSRSTNTSSAPQDIYSHIFPSDPESSDPKPRRLPNLPPVIIPGSCSYLATCRIARRKDTTGTTMEHTGAA